jgi:nitroimidazol reductase NimA-like FMN-containing flavoprotein (pyridoxamine 5'-phosphate oxidase superfamily)
VFVVPESARSPWPARRDPDGKEAAMRRTDRDATAADTIAQILAACDIGRLALMDGSAPYIVPLHFAADDVPGRLVVYFHGATSGHKLDLIGDGAWAGFETDRRLAPSRGETACEFTAYYESVIASGWVEPCRDVAEKRHALTLIARKFAPDLPSDFSGKPVDFVTVLRMRLDGATAKRNPPPAETAPSTAAEDPASLANIDLPD